MKLQIGHSFPAFIIAEAGVNHNGDLDTALRLVEAAARAGANAVKFQTFSADRLVTRKAPKAAYQRLTTNSSESQYAMLKRFELSHLDHERLLAHAQAHNILFLSTPFDIASADLLIELDVFALKIGSGELTNLPLLEHVARQAKTIILSTGMAYLSEVEEAVNCILSISDAPLILLHCVSNYPAREIDVNLHAMLTMRQAFALPVGYSDHTIGISIAIAAVALGACVIEKHFTLDRSLPGPDHKASLELEEIRALVHAIRNVENALGDGIKRPAASEYDTARVSRKSIVSQVDIPVGTIIKDGMLDIKRPGTGISPRYLGQVIGRVARTFIPADSVIEWEMI